MTATFIYGSCVSRDTFEHLRPHGFALVDYIARQSLLSVYTRMDLADLPELEVSSPFQRRMIAGDWGSSLSPTLQRRREDIDLLLWDLCDERLGVWQLPNGRILTRSVDAISAGMEAHLPHDTELLPLGNERHRELFTARARQFRKRLDVLGLRDRTVMLAPAWADRDVEGRPTPASYGLDAAEANRVLEDYYTIVEKQVRIPIIRLGADEVTAAADHQWGPAPFHYAEDVYERLVQRIRAVAGGDATGTPEAESEVPATPRQDPSGLLPSELDLGVSQRQTIATTETRPKDPEATLREQRRGTLRLPPHPVWEGGDLTDWTADPFTDRNWQFQHHTLRWLNAARHLALEGDETARGFWLSVVRSWAETNVPAAEAPSPWAWRDMVDGTRAVAVSLGAPLVPDSEHWFVPLLEAHRDWLSDERNLAGRNHAMHQHVGLLVVGAALRDQRAMATAHERLVALFAETFDEQGGNDEGSAAYHQLNLRWWTQVWRRVAAERMEVPDFVADRLVQASTVLAHLAQPDGMLAQIGDGPRVEVGRGLGEASDYVATGGRKGRAPEETVVVLQRGYVLSRSGWDLDRGADHSHMVLRHGADLRSHSHQDRGSVHLYTAGRAWLVDGGFLNYQLNDAKRSHTLSRAAHNLPFLEGLDYDDKAEVELVRQSVTEDAHDFTLWFPGYQGAFLERRVTYLRGPDCWIVQDSATADEPVRLSHQWLVDTGVHVSHQGSRLDLTSDGTEAQLRWIGTTPEVDVHAATDGDMRGWIATRWNTLEPGTLATAAASHSHTPRLTMLFAGSHRGVLAVPATHVTVAGTVTAQLMRGQQRWSVRLDQHSVRVAAGVPTG